MTLPAEKSCAVCGRRITWRKRWAKNWEQVRYCSQACRRRRRRPEDEALEKALLALLARQPRGGTVRPEEAVAVVAPRFDGDLREPARMAARRLAQAGHVEVLQHGRRVDPSAAKGGFEVRRA